MDFYFQWNLHSKRYFQWQFNQIKSFIGDRVVDIAAGPGNLTDFFLNKQYTAVDLNPEYLDFIKQRFPASPNIQTLKFDCLSEDFFSWLRTYKPDSLVCFNFIEHLENDHIFLSRLIAEVRQNTTICLLVPAHNFLYGNLDKLDGHYRRYNRKMMVELCGKLENVSVEKLTYFNSVGAIGWFITNKILKVKNHRIGNYKVMNKITPFLEYIEGKVDICFGLSVICVLRKL